VARRIAWILLNVCGGIVCTISLFWLCATLYTRNNTQPAFYHPDEGGKSAQILSDRRNYNHPQLMLEMALQVIAWEKVPLDGLDIDAVTIIGRRGSAYLAAAAVVLCAWAGLAAVRSWFGFVMGAVGAGLCPALLTHAHFFKEDATLVFGVACVLLVGSVLCARRWHGGYMLILAYALGIACGVAASGKYSGAVFLGPALLLVIAVSIGRWWLMPILPALVIAGALWSWTGINYRAVENWDDFRQGFDNEANHSQTEHFGMTMDKPNGYFADAVWTEAMPHVKVLAMVAPLALLLQRQRRGDRWPPDFGWWLVLCAGVYLAALSHSVLPFFRYALPVTVMLYLLAALSVVWIIRLIELPALWRGGAITALLMVVIGLQADRVADYDQQIANDSRDTLRAWANRALPPFARIVVDEYTCLRGMGSFPSPYATRLRVSNGSFFAADAGNIDDLRRAGYMYVAIASSNYDRFFSPYTKPPTELDGSPDHRAIEKYNRRRGFYKTLFEKYPIIWESHADHPMWTFANPEITVFRIGDQPPARAREQ